MAKSPMDFPSQEIWISLRGLMVALMTWKFEKSQEGASEFNFVKMEWWNKRNEGAYAFPKHATFRKILLTLVSKKNLKIDST